MHQPSEESVDEEQRDGRETQLSFSYLSVHKLVSASPACASASRHWPAATSVRGSVAVADVVQPEALHYTHTANVLYTPTNSSIT